MLRALLIVFYFINRVLVYRVLSKNLMFNDVNDIK
jgi:hypothetical protein